MHFFGFATTTKRYTRLNLRCLLCYGNATAWWTVGLFSPLRGAVSLPTTAQAARACAALIKTAPEEEGTYHRMVRCRLHSSSSPQTRTPQTAPQIPAPHICLVQYPRAAALLIILSFFFGGLAIFAVRNVAPCNSLQPAKSFEHFTKPVYNSSNYLAYVMHLRRHLSPVCESIRTILTNAQVGIFWDSPREQTNVGESHESDEKDQARNVRKAEYTSAHLNESSIRLGSFVMAKLL